MYRLFFIAGKSKWKGETTYRNLLRRRGNLASAHTVAKLPKSPAEAAQSYCECTYSYPDADGDCNLDLHRSLHLILRLC